MDPLVINIVIALITGLCTAIPTVIATTKAADVKDALQQERLEEVTKKIDILTEEVKKYNDFDKRLAIIENIVFKRGGA